MFFLKELPSAQMIQGYVAATDAGDATQIGDALLLMRRASVLVRKIDQYFAGNDLSQLKFLILVVIDREPERASLRQSEIITRLDVSKPVLHRTVKAMLDMGLLLELPDDTDARAHQIALTPAGKAVLHDLLPQYFRIISDFMSDERS